MDVDIPKETQRTHSFKTPYSYFGNLGGLGSAPSNRRSQHEGTLDIGLDKPTKTEEPHANVVRYPESYPSHNYSNHSQYAGALDFGLDKSPKTDHTPAFEALYPKVGIYEPTSELGNGN